MCHSDLRWVFFPSNAGLRIAFQEVRKPEPPHKVLARPGAPTRNINTNGTCVAKRTLAVRSFSHQAIRHSVPSARSRCVCSSSTVLRLLPSTGFAKLGDQTTTLQPHVTHHHRCCLLGKPVNMSCEVQKWQTPLLSPSANGQRSSRTCLCSEHAKRN